MEPSINQVAENVDGARKISVLPDSSPAQAAAPCKVDGDEWARQMGLLKPSASAPQALKMSSSSISTGPQMNSVPTKVEESSGLQEIVHPSKTSIFNCVRVATSNSLITSITRRLLMVGSTLPII